MRQGSRHAPPVVGRSEGARGLWRVYAERLAAYAVGIVDFSPAVQDLWKGAAAWLDGRTTPARRGGWARHRRRHGQPDGGGADVVEALEGEGLPDSARDTWTAVSASLARHREPIDYAQDKALGLPTTEYVQLWLSFLQATLEANAPESAQKNISLAILRNLDIPVPPLPLQHEFAAQVAAVERLKAAQRISLAKLDALFASLQHRAFRGEL